MLTSTKGLHNKNKTPFKSDSISEGSFLSERWPLALMQVVQVKSMKLSCKNKQTIGEGHEEVCIKVGWRKGAMFCLPLGGEKV